MDKAGGFLVVAMATEDIEMGKNEGSNDGDDDRSGKSYGSQVGAIAKLIYRKRTKFIIIGLLLTLLSLVVDVHVDLRSGCLKWDKEAVKNSPKNKAQTAIHTMGKVAKKLGSVVVGAVKLSSEPRDGGADGGGTAERDVIFPGSVVAARSESGGGTLAERNVHHQAGDTLAGWESDGVGVVSSDAPAATLGSAPVDAVSAATLVDRGGDCRNGLAAVSVADADLQVFVGDAPEAIIGEADPPTGMTTTAAAERAAASGDQLTNLGSMGKADADDAS